MCLGCKGTKHLKRIKKTYKKILRVNATTPYKPIGDSMSPPHMDVSSWLAIFPRNVNIITRSLVLNLGKVLFFSYAIKDPSINFVKKEGRIN